MEVEVAQASRAPLLPTLHIEHDLYSDTLPLGCDGPIANKKTASDTMNLVVTVQHSKETTDPG